MPLPTRKHVPTFTAEQLAEARRIAGQTSAPHRSVRRAKLTLLLAGEPEVSHRTAAASLGVSYGAVRKWRRRWSQQGWSLADAPRSGRPGTFSPSGPHSG